MPKEVFQVCYTNASEERDGKITSGWQALAVSEAIPPDAYRTCVNMQNLNSSIQTAMTDECGNVLNLLEVCGDDKYLYMMRSQYGMQDRLGRPNMFSHAYIFPWEDESVLLNPNSFLTIADSNFKSNENDAKHFQGTFKRLQEFYIWRAIQASGLQLITVYLFIQCIYAQMTGKRFSSPLYVQYDGTDLQMRALLYCAYTLLPYYLRKNLRSACAGGVTEHGKNLIFSVEAQSHEYFFNPATGENNLLTDKLRKKIQRLGYVDYAARVYIYWGASKYLQTQGAFNAEEDIKQYFRTLNGLAISLGDSTASNELFLKIANQLIENCQPTTFTDEVLEANFHDALRAKAYGSNLMGHYIFSMFSEIIERGMKVTLTDENMQNLFAWSDTPVFRKFNVGKEQIQCVIK